MSTTSRPCRAAGCLLAVGVLVAATAPARAADWQTMRHDVRNTAFSPGTAKIKVPVVRWRMRLGGTVARPEALDADLDGSDDIFGFEAGSATVRSTAGTVLWKTPPIGATELMSRGDLDGDGVQELLVRTASGCAILSSTTGKVRWQAPADRADKLSSARLVDLDGDGLDDLVLSNAGPIYVYRSVAGKLQAQAQIPAEIDGAKLRTLTFITADLSGDGLPEIVVNAQTDPEQGKLLAFSAQTGAVLGALSLHKSTCGAGITVPRPGQAPVLLCWISRVDVTKYQHLHRVMALELKADALAMRWKLELPDPDADRLVVAPRGVGDLDGDGKAELIVSTFTGGKWSLLALDALTGKTLHVVQAAPSSGPQLRALWSTAPGPAWILVADSADKQPAVDAPRRLLRWSRNQGFTEWGNAGSSPILPAWLEEPGTSGGMPRPYRGPARGAGKGEQVEVLRREDSDGDGVADRLVLLTTAAGQLKALATRTFGGGVQTPIGLHRKDGERRLLVVHDGYGHALDAALQTRNDADGDGLPELRYTGQLHPTFSVYAAKSEATRVVVSARGVVRVLDAAKAAPGTEPVVEFERHFRWPGHGTWAELDGKPGGTLLVRHTGVDGRARLTALDGIKKRWEFVNPSPEVRWRFNEEADGLLLADLDGDGDQEIIINFETSKPIAPKGAMLFALDGVHGKPLWFATQPCATDTRGQHTAVDLGGSSPIAIAAVYHMRYRCNLATGALIGVKTSPLSSTYGVPILLDADGTPPLDVVFGGAAHGLQLELGAGHKTSWTFPGPLTWYHRRATLVPLPAGPALFQSTNGSSEILALDAVTGAVLWRHGFLDGAALPPKSPAAFQHRTGGLIGVRDLDGDAKPDLLFHTTEGRLYAVAAMTGVVHWSMAYGGALSDPVAADVDGDGVVEILIGTPDGHLTVIGENKLGVVAAVRENDGSGPALKDADDIDAQEDAAKVHINWTPLVGAEGYEARLRTAGGAVIVPWVEVGKFTVHTFSGLHLQLGIRYVSEVRAHATSASKALYSQPTPSDGLEIEDHSPPSILSFKAEPVVLAGDESLVRFTAELRDATRLASVELQTRDVGEQTRHAWRRPLATPTYSLDQTWNTVDGQGKRLPAGGYSATLTARDARGYYAQAQLEILLCAAGESASEGGCAPPGIRGGEVAGTVEPPRVRQEGAEDGCAAGRASRDGGSLVLFALALAMLGAWRAGTGRAGSRRAGTARAGDQRRSA